MSVSVYCDWSSTDKQTRCEKKEMVQNELWIITCHKLQFLTSANRLLAGEENKTWLPSGWLERSWNHNNIIQDEGSSNVYKTLTLDGIDLKESLPASPRWPCNLFYIHHGFNYNRHNSSNNHNNKLVNKKIQQNKNNNASCSQTSFLYNILWGRGT